MATESERSAQAIARALEKALTTEEGDGPNIVEAFLAVAGALHALGNGSASTPMGGMEALGKSMLDSSESLSSAIGELASALSDHADALREHAAAMHKQSQ